MNNIRSFNILGECGYDFAALGFSLSFKTTVTRAMELMPKYAFGTVPGENKFLREIQVWVDANLPRFLWQELDQYKVGTTTLSESTVHTLAKRGLYQADFYYPLEQGVLESLNVMIKQYVKKEITLADLKNALPEGFMQRRISNGNYATLQNIYIQRKNHKLELWDFIRSKILLQCEHPEFIHKEYGHETD